MLTEFIRVFTRKGATLTDISIENAEKSAVAYADNDFLYIAQKFPFNNIFFLLGAVNTETTGKIKVEYLHQKEWVTAVDVIDFTTAMKKLFGMVQFSLTKDKQWPCTPHTWSDSDVPDELKGINISECHWLRVSFTFAPVALTIKAATYAFTSTAKINGVDINGSKYFETFKTGKSDWVDEIITASEMMMSEMKSAGLLKAPGQVILLDDFYLPCSYRTLMHIYTQMGKGYQEKHDKLEVLYNKFLGGPKTIDKNGDGKIDKSETGATTTRLTR